MVCRWRNWNFYQGDITQATMEANMRALASRTRSTKGRTGNVSLIDLGFDRAGLDDNWQACGTGLSGSFHSEQGKPLINRSRFPDMKAMVLRPNFAPCVPAHNWRQLTDRAAAVVAAGGLGTLTRSQGMTEALPWHRHCQHTEHAAHCMRWGSGSRSAGTTTTASVAKEPHTCMPTR